MLFTTAISALSLASAALGAAHGLDKRGSPSRNKLYARADVFSEANGIEAHFEFWGRLDGTGTFVKVEVLEGLFANDTRWEGPFAYHVHTNPVGKDRNCTAALGHLDPLLVSESLICDPAFPKFCQEGDLAGKHGKLNGTTTGAISTFGYTDDYLRFFPEDFSILGRSVVIHAANKTRLACGDIISTLDGTASSQWQPTYKPSKFVKHYPTAPPFNPPQVITPIVGLVFPNDTVIQNLPFPLPNPAIPIFAAVNVELTTVSQTVFVNGTQTTASLPVEKSSSAKAPFKGYKDASWAWD